MGKKQPAPGIEVHLLIDASGSMDTYKKQTITGANEFIKNLAMAITPITLTVTTFNPRSTDLITQVPIYEVPVIKPEDYQPIGGTALYKAITKSLERLGASQAAAKALVILTDGVDSGYGGREALKEVIKRVRKEGVLVAYLGAKQNALEYAGTMGIDRKLSIDYSLDNVVETMTVAAEIVLRFKSGGLKAAQFTDEERLKVKGRMV